MQRRALLLSLAAAGVQASPLDAQLARLHETYRPRQAWHAGPGWRAAALQTARRLILQPGDDGSPIATETLAQEDRGDHIAARLRLRMNLGDTAEALWLRPKRPGPHPAVLALHAHGANFELGAEKLIRPLASDPPALQQAAAAWATRYDEGQPIGEALVRRGMAVLAVDAPGFGSRSRPGFARDDQQALAAHLMQFGHHWAGLIASDDARSLRWLREQAGVVDPARIAVWGFSMGAQRAWQLAALDEGVRVCAAAHWMAPRRDGLLRPGEHQLRGQSAFAMLHPGLAAELDHPDIAALIAPRPLLMLGSAEDGLFPIEAVRRAVGQLRQVWGADGGFRFVETPGGHRVDSSSQALIVGWMAKQLGG